jgi:hypothetical protein
MIHPAADAEKWGPKHGVDPSAPLFVVVVGCLHDLLWRCLDLPVSTWSLVLRHIATTPPDVALSTV